MLALISMEAVSNYRLVTLLISKMLAYVGNSQQFSCRYRCSNEHPSADGVTFQTAAGDLLEFDPQVTGDPAVKQSQCI